MKELKSEQKVIYKAFVGYDSAKEKMIEIDKVKNMSLVQEIEKLIDIKREKEFDVQMIDQATESRVKRLEK